MCVCVCVFVWPDDRCFGGDVSWEVSGGKGASFSEPDESVTHQVVDRPQQTHRFLGRYIL